MAVNLKAGRALFAYRIYVPSLCSQYGFAMPLTTSSAFVLVNVRIVLDPVSRRWLANACFDYFNYDRLCVCVISIDICRMRDWRCRGGFGIVSLDRE